MGFGLFNVAHTPNGHIRGQEDLKVIRGQILKHLCVLLKILNFILY